MDITKGDKYRGAVVEVCLCRNRDIITLIGVVQMFRICNYHLLSHCQKPRLLLAPLSSPMTAISRTYRQHIISPILLWRLLSELYYSILSKQRKPVGYIDVAKLKAKWEADEANPVRLVNLS